MRRGLVLVTVMCLSLVACSSSAKTGEPTPLATVASPPTTPAQGLNPSQLPGSFHLSVYIVSVDLTAHTITIDPMSFLTGQAATDAFKADNPGAKEGPPNDYYIKNTAKDHDVLPLSPTAVVKLVHVGGTDHTVPKTVPASSLVGYQSLSSRPFVVSGVDGKITGVTETFVP